MSTERRWTAAVLTLFPDAFPGPLGLSLAGKALENGLWRLETVDIREFARNKHRSVDDVPFGGGPGMVMRPEVVGAAYEHARATLVPANQGPAVYLSPRGRLLDQALAAELAAQDGLILLCGRYEGVDQRVLDACDFVEVSVGDYVLSGGELAALVLMDAVLRLRPGVLGDPTTLDEESFSRGLLEYPHYTRPRTWSGRDVPEVLTSGHHKNIEAWRQQQAETLTKRRRPDLWARYEAVKGM
tara:strand:- start:2944 stop:3669 length:726 start_codon:yes stop_codon:yes gene_type:complete